MRVALVGQFTRWPHAPDNLGLKQGAGDMGWDWLAVDPLDVGGRLTKEDAGTRVAERVNAFRPDLVVHVHADSFRLDVISRVSRGAAQVFSMFDYRTPDMLGAGEWKWWSTVGGRLSMVTVSAEEHRGFWGDEFRVPARFWRQGCWRAPRAEPDSAEACDVVFVGQHYPHVPHFRPRAELVGEIREALAAEGVSLREVNGPTPETRNEVWRRMPVTYASAKLSLDVSHFWDSWGYCSGRHWDTAAFGTCSLTRRFPGCQLFFPKGAKYYFETPAQCASLAVSLLRDGDARRRAGERARRIGREEHCYRRRFEELLSWL